MNAEFVNSRRHAGAESTPLLKSTLQYDADRAASPARNHSRVAKNIAWNVLGLCCPSLVALYAFPRLISLLGKDAFGVLTLTWALVGTAGVFDLGLNRALTKAVASAVAEGRELECRRIVWTVALCVSVIGLLLAITTVLVAPWLVTRVLSIPSQYQADATRAFIGVAICLPFVLLSAALIGTISAFHRFDYVNAIRIPAGIYSFIAPLAVLSFANTLTAAVCVLVVGRIVTCFLYGVLCFKVMPGLSKAVIDLRVLPDLFRTGGWITVSNLISPVMANSQRFLIGAFASVAGVTYFSTPNEIVSRVGVMSIAISSVLFPTFSAEFHRGGPGANVALLKRGITYVLFLEAPLLLAIATMAELGLRLWLGSEFSLACTHITQLLAVCVLLNSLVQLPLTVLQATGSANRSAKFHMAEMPIYILLSLIAIRKYGILGAASCDVARASIDFVYLSWAANRHLRAPAIEFVKILSTVGFALLVFIPSFVLATEWSRFSYLTIALLLPIPIAWHLLLAREDKEAIRMLVPPWGRQQYENK